jgi:serine/threonine-protein kinase
MSEGGPSITPRGPLSLRLSLRVDSICARLEDDPPRHIPAPHFAPRPDPVAIARRVDALCVVFVGAWRLGETPRIEDHLPPRDDPARNPALRELVALERELRCGEGLSWSPSSYRDRFPEDADLLADLLEGGEDEEKDKAADETTDEHEEDDPRAPGSLPASKGLPASTRVGEYELMEEIGRGGMGVVFRARHASLGRTVALKMILSGDFASRSETRRFRAEAEAAANLDHPHIVPIHEVGEHAGRPYYTMRLLSGGSLAQRLRKSRIDPRGAARLLSTVARAMHHAHRRGFVHRDLKPANVLFDEAGRPFVTDFGLAKRLGQTGPTGQGALMGTPGYMAPEQAAGRADITASADIYSLGAILYKVLAGRPPFRASTVIETLVQVMEGEPVSPRRLNPSVPVDLEFICLKCLEKDPARRYASAAALADDLDRHLLGEHIEGCRGKSLDGLLRKFRREPEIATRLGALSILSTLVQLKFVLGGFPHRTAHLLVTAVLFLWALATVASWYALRRAPRAEAIRMAWIAAEVVLISAILRIRDDTMSSGVVVYPLLIVAAGLWSRIRLVWWTTATAAVAYTLLIVDSFARKGFAGRENNEGIVLGVLVVTGFVVAKHVNRILAISSYYEHRTDR